jgi:hypothetical protein
MEIRMECQDVTEKDEWLDAYFTCVALDPIARKPTHGATHLTRNSRRKGSV